MFARRNTVTIFQSKTGIRVERKMNSELIRARGWGMCTRVISHNDNILVRFETESNESMRNLPKTTYNCIADVPVQS